MKKSVILVLFVFIAASAATGQTVIQVERIEFRGVKNLDKYEIIRNSKVKVMQKGIVIDVDSIKETMNRSVMIDSYDVAFDNRQMVITVSEKYPLFSVLKVDRNKSVPCLVDENRIVLDSGRFFRTDMPIIITDKDFFENESSGRYIKGLFENLLQLSREMADFSGELSEVEIYPAGALRVKLKNRRTGFMINNDLNGFKKIEKSAAYLDSVNAYPEAIDLRERRILIRQ